MHFSPSPEFSLLLACCRPGTSEAVRAQQQDLLARVDAGHFLALVDRHRVAPMVCQHLLKLPREVLPAAMAPVLMEKQQANVFRQLDMMREQVRLHTLLESASIRYVTLKGLPVAQCYFGDAGLRTSRDIDLLFAPQDLDLAIKLLLDAGYISEDGFCELTPRQRAYKKSAYHDCSFAAPDSGVCVELHWRLAEFPHMLSEITVDKNAGSIRYIELAAQQIPLLAKDEMLLYLCAHGTMHLWFRLKWIFDLPVVLESSEWDWPALFAKAGRNRCMKHLALGLLLAHRLCDWVMPAAVEAWLVQQDVERAYQDVLAALQAPESEFSGTPPVSVWLRHVRYHSGFLEKKDALVSTVRKYATSPNDWLSLPLPDALFPLYFVLRPFLWLWRLGRRFVRHRIQNLAESSGASAQ